MSSVNSLVLLPSSSSLELPLLGPGPRACSSHTNLGFTGHCSAPERECTLQSTSTMAGGHGLILMKLLVDVCGGR